jgi:hypothetical protein
MKKPRVLPSPCRTARKGRTPPVSVLPLALLLALALLACNFGGLLSRTPPGGAPGVTPVAVAPAASALPGAPGGTAMPDDLESAMPLDQAVAMAQTDNRPQLLDKMGQPDAFEIVFAQLNGQPVREEKWSYFDDNLRFDLINGALLYTVNLDPVPDLSINASIYDPLAFKAGMSLADVQALMPDQNLVQLDTADYGVPGGLLLAGRQILLGFDNGQLVYVRTFELTPEAGS